MLDIFEATWGNKVVTGEEKAEKPGLLAFKNSDIAMRILKRHLDNDSKIAIHCDVDMDGIGTGYIMGRFITNRTNKVPLYIINKDKEHGIQQKHVDFFRDKKLDLMIIVDSSSNEIDIIKQFNCDVIVIDHHEVLHSELYGHTLDNTHEYVIVNNTISNNDISSIKCWVSQFNIDTANKLQNFDGDDRMSCGLVVYELLRLYCDTMGMEKLLENLLLFQWAGVTLFTDSIILNTPRNQWYIENTVHSTDIEVTLQSILGELNKYKTLLDKSLINYTIAPVINKAIRAGHSADALNVIIFKPKGITDLLKYRETQDNAINIGISDFKATDSYILRDMSNTEVHKNYNGVIASRLCGEYNKNCVVYKVTNGIAEGSFRGRISGLNYREIIDGYSDDSWGMGHKTAFGFACPVDKLDDVMSKLTSIESSSSNQYLLTAGKLNDKCPGKFVIKDMDEFKRQGGIWKLGIGNSKVSNDEQIFITVDSADLVLIEQHGKLYLYNALGMICKAFEPVTEPVVNIYIECSRQIECYIK